jgi:hypothetical protein
VAGDILRPGDGLGLPGRELRWDLLASYPPKDGINKPRPTGPLAFSDQLDRLTDRGPVGDPVLEENLVSAQEQSHLNYRRLVVKRPTQVGSQMSREIAACSVDSVDEGPNPARVLGRELSARVADPQIKSALLLKLP